MVLKKLRGDRNGQMVVVFTGALVVLCGIAALTLDLGNLVQSQGRMQNAADSAALAAMLEVWEQRAAGVSEGTAHQRATDEAERFVRENYPECGASVAWGHWVGGSFSNYATDDSYTVVPNAVRVRASRGSSDPGGPVTTFFAGVFDIDAVPQQATATARYEHVGLVPLSVYEPDVPGKGGGFVIYNDTETAPGNCGLLDFDGGENSLDQVRDWMTYGYFGDFYVDPATGDIVCSGSTGLKSALKKAIQDHIKADNILVACVYDSVSGTGAGVTYNIVGFVAVEIEGITLDKKGDEIISVSARTVSKYKPGTGETDGMMRDFMKLQIME